MARHGGVRAAMACNDIDKRECAANPHRETLTTAGMRMFDHDSRSGELRGAVPTLHIDNEREYCTGTNPNFLAMTRSCRYRQSQHHSRMSAPDWGFNRRIADC